MRTVPGSLFLSLGLFFFDSTSRCQQLCLRAFTSLEKSHRLGR